MGSNTISWSPSISDRVLKNWLRGMQLGKNYDYQIVKGCAVTGEGTATLSISSGKVMIAGMLIEFNAYGYTPLNASDTYYIYAELNEVLDANDYVTGVTFNFAMNTADSSTADYYFKVGTFDTDGDSLITAATIDVGLGESWYPYSNIKITPSQFVSSAAATPAFVSTSGGDVTTTGAAALLYGTFTVPQGWKVTRGIVWDDGTGLAYTYNKNDVDTGAASAIGNDTCGTEADLTDTSVDGTNYFTAQVAAVNSHLVYGGQVRIELIEA